MAVTPESAIVTLETAMASGTLEVTFEDGRSVRYQSIKDLQQAIAYFRGQSRAASGKPAVSVTVGAYYRG